MTTAGIEIQRVNPLEFSGEIKKLFLDHERPEFPEFFDRAYPSSVEGDVTSWIGRDAGGRLVMHQGRFSKHFRSRGETARAGLFVNLIVSRELRSFFPAHALLRRALADSQADGLDFVYTDPNRMGETVTKLAGFAAIGTLRRFVLPLGGGMLATLVRGYRLARRLVGPYRGLRTESRPAAGQNAPSDSEFEPGGNMIVPTRPSALYRQRLRDYPGTSDAWCTLRPENDESVCGMCLTRGPETDGSAYLVTLLHRGGVALPAILHAVAQDAERRGVRSLHAWTMDGSSFAHTLRQAGFLARADRSTIYGLPFTTLGTQIVTSGERWEITDLDCDRGI